MTVARPGDRRLMAAPDACARDVLRSGGFGAGSRLTGLTKCQFSLIDLLVAILGYTGPADVLLSTWTVGIRDAENVDVLVTRGHIRSLRLLTDRSFPTRQPQYVKRIIEVFGDQSICVTRTHAKFMTIRNEKWNVCVRSSMNLNRNLRFEHFDIDEDIAMCEFFDAHARELYALTPRGFGVACRIVDETIANARIAPEQEPVGAPNAITPNALTTDELLADVLGRQAERIG